jgi:hypothetical protein
MIERSGNTVVAVITYLANKVGKTGLSPSLYVYKVSASAHPLVVNGVSGTEIGMGAYKYALSGSSFETGAMYLFVATTTDTSVDQQYIYALWIADTSWVVFLDRALSVIESNIRGADDDTLETLSDQLDIIRNGGGSNLVTITVNDSDGDPIIDTRVEIRSSGGSYLTHKVTDGSGQVTLSLNDGTYKVYCRNTGYTFTLPETLVVDEDGETLTITGTAIVIPAAPDGSYVTVWEYCYAEDQTTGLESITGFIEILDKPFHRSDIPVRVQRVELDYNTTTYVASKEVVRGARIRFYVEELGIDVIKKVSTDPDVTEEQVLKEMEDVYDEDSEIPSSWPYRK